MVSSFALRDRQTELLGAAVILRDLTVVKRLETERRHLVSMFAHDLKTPVVGMAGLIRRLVQGKAGPLSAEQTRYLETVDREMARVEKLITSFLEFARLDLRLLTPHPEAIQVAEECREVITLLTPLAEAKGMKLETSFPGELPSLRVDPLLFRRLLENLLSNAIKFSPPGSAVLLKVWQEGSELGFAVQDQGPGIEPDRIVASLRVFLSRQGRGRAGGLRPGPGHGEAHHRFPRRPPLGGYGPRPGRHLLFYPATRNALNPRAFFLKIEPQPQVHHLRLEAPPQLRGVAAGDGYPAG